MAHILVVDDDLQISGLLCEALTRAGYAVTSAYSGTEALLALERRPADLVLLDLMLPGLSGEELLPRLAGTPVIVVSAKGDADGKAALLLGGAADYVQKPFALKELLARVALRLREAPAAGGGTLRAGSLQMDCAAHAVTAGSRPVHLTRTEYAILRQLMQNAGRVVTRSALWAHIAADTPDCTEASLKMHISNLRKKLRAAAGDDCIEAVWGIGFKLNAG